MAALGEYLRSHRDVAGMSLDEIAERTRISVAQLEALEGERFERLPGGVFNLSFVRQYCRCVGADEEHGVSLMKQATAYPPTAPTVEHFGGRSDEYLARGPMGRIGETISNVLQAHGGAIASVTVGLLLLVGGVYSYDVWEQQQLAEQRAQTEIAEAQAAERQASEQAEARAREAALEAKPQAPIELQVEVVETVWILASADGERVFEGIFQPGQTKPIYAREEVMLRVGNAGGVVLALNGEPLPPVGPRGHVRRVMVTTEGMQIIDRPQPQGPGTGTDSARFPATTAANRWAELAWSDNALR